MEKLIEQQPMVQRTAKFIERYGLKTLWLAQKTRIPKNYLSTSNVTRRVAAGIVSTSERRQHTTTTNHSLKLGVASE